MTETKSDERKKDNVVEAEQAVCATNVEDITIPAEEKTDENIIKLSKTYRFEGREIKEIDLTGISSLNALQMQKIESLYRKITKNTSASPELTLDYALAAANVLTDLPLEFLMRISGKDIVKIKSRVVNFLYSED